MRAHLLHTGLLLSLFLAGCQGNGDRSPGAVGSPIITPAISGATGRTTAFHFVANGDFAQASWFDEPDRRRFRTTSARSSGGWTSGWPPAATTQTDRTPSPDTTVSI